jgi:hypothetical protein
VDVYFARALHGMRCWTNRLINTSGRMKPQVGSRWQKSGQ